MKMLKKATAVFLVVLMLVTSSPLNQLSDNFIANLIDSFSINSNAAFVSESIRSFISGDYAYIAVTDLSGRPVEGAVVTIYSGKSVECSASTNANGYAIFYYEEGLFNLLTVSAHLSIANNLDLCSEEVNSNGVWCGSDLKKLLDNKGTLVVKEPRYYVSLSFGYTGRTQKEKDDRYTTIKAVIEGFSNRLSEYTNGHCLLSSVDIKAYDSDLAASKAMHDVYILDDPNSLGEDWETQTASTFYNAPKIVFNYNNGYFVGSVLAHESGHFLFSFRDEYINGNGDGRNGGPVWSNKPVSDYGLMDKNTRELSTSKTYSYLTEETKADKSLITRHYDQYGESTEETFGNGLIKLADNAGYSAQYTFTDGTIQKAKYGFAEITVPEYSSNAKTEIGEMLEDIPFRIENSSIDIQYSNQALFIDANINNKIESIYLDDGLSVIPICQENEFYTIPIINENENLIIVYSDEGTVSKEEYSIISDKETGAVSLNYRCDDLLFSGKKVVSNIINILKCPEPYKISECLTFNDDLNYADTSWYRLSERGELSEIDTEVTYGEQNEIIYIATCEEAGKYFLLSAESDIDNTSTISNIETTVDHETDSVKLSFEDSQEKYLYTVYYSHNKKEVELHENCSFVQSTATSDICMDIDEAGTVYYQILSKDKNGTTFDDGLTFQFNYELLDSNYDGIPDSWFDKYYMLEDTDTVAQEDPDNDGYTNIEEFINGTNPLDLEEGKKIEAVELGSDFNDTVIDVIVAEELFDGFPKEVIDLVADTMFNMKSVVDLSSYDISTDDAVALFSAVAKYYPVEYSLIAGGDFTYKIVVSPSMDRIMKIRFYYGDDANLSAYQKRVNDLNAEIDSLVAKIEGMDDFEKALYIHDYIVLNCEYDLELLEILETEGRLTGELRSERYTEYSVLVNGTGICGSYALAYRAILNAAGMECLYLSSSQMNHAWNLVKINGEWYHVDCCWDDPVPDTYGRARREYFLRTDEEIMSLNHYSWTPGQYKATDLSFSNMPRDYDMRQKYDYGTDLWYSLSGSKLYTCDMSGNNKEELGQLTGNSISVDNGKIYYSSGRSVFGYDPETNSSKLVYKIPKSKSGSRINDARITNVYVKDNTAEYYKYIYDQSGKGSTIYEVGLLSSQGYSTVTGIELNEDSISVDIFDSATITATVLTSRGTSSDVEIDWISLNENVVTVSDGKITAKNVGTATVTASIGSFSASCEVTVSGDGLSGYCGTNAKWNFDSEKGLLEITGSGAITDYELDMAAPWSRLTDLITNVIINDSITEIGDRAFYSLTGVTRIVLSKSLENIGEYAFWNCKKISTISIPDSVVLVDWSAFEYCNSLEAVHITDLRSWCNILFVGSHSNPLEYAKNLYLNGNLIVDLIIPSDVKELKGSSFENADCLETVVVSDSVEKISDYVFTSCDNLRTIEIGKSVNTIGTTSFLNCNSLSEIIVSSDNKAFCSVDGVLLNYEKTKIFTYPGGKKDKVYNIPKTVTELRFYGFYKNDYLEIINIHDEVTCISCWCNTTSSFPNWNYFYAFKYFNNLKEINVDKNNENYCSVDGVLFSKDMTQLFRYPAAKPEVVYIVPETVADVDLYSFSNTKYLRSLIVKSPSTNLSNTSIAIFENAMYSSDNVLEYLFVNNSTRISTRPLYNYFKKLKKVYAPNLDFNSGLLNNDTSYYSNIPIGCSNSISINHSPHEHAYFLMGYQKMTNREDGYEYWECYCGESSYKTILHNYDDPTVTEPTCIVDGYKSAKCTNCGETEIIDTIPAIGSHDYQLVSTTLGDCLNEPVYHYTCSICGDTYDKTGKIDEGHSYKDIVVQPTCTEKGYKKSICEVCGETVISDFVSPLGHNMEITHSGTYCSAHDTLEYKCKRCDYTESVAADPSKLETKTFVVEPTCTKSGSETEVCVLCGATVSTKILNPLSHEYSSDFTVDVEATCTTEGRQSQHCIRCDAKRAITKIEATGHKNLSIINAIEATCTSQGYTGDTYCSDCKSIISKGTSTEMVAHNFMAIVTAPTCTSEGYTTYVCTVCSYSYDGDEMPTIDHSYDDNGICKTCGHSKTENCTCMCHKGGFIGFIWKIIRFFWKLFKMNPVCECGVAHY